MSLVWMLKYSNCYISIMFLCLIKGENGEDCKCVESKQASKPEIMKKRKKEGRLCTVCACAPPHR